MNSIPKFFTNTWLTWLHKQQSAEWTTNSAAADGLRNGGMQSTGNVRPIATFLRNNLDHDTPWCPLLMETVFYREFQPVTLMVRVKTVQHTNGSSKYVFVS